MAGAGADVMPRSQLESALVAELGPNWRSMVADFDYEPLAAASIGQVHALEAVTRCQPVTSDIPLVWHHMNAVVG